MDSPMDRLAKVEKELQEVKKVVLRLVGTQRSSIDIAKDHAAAIKEVIEALDDLIGGVKHGD